MTEASSKYLTVRELSEFLHLKERKIYSLASEGKIPCSRATGKLLFPREGVEQWLVSHSTGGAPLPARTERPMIFVGSHDPLLDWALRESRSGIPTFFDGSLDGLDRLKAGQAAAGGLHIYEATGDGWNVQHVTEALGDAEVVLLEWAWRERGLVVAPDNPRKIGGLRDLKGVRVVPRQAEAGTQVLFDALLQKEGLKPRDMQLVDPPARSEVDLVATVADGQADAGFGLAGLARQFKLGFVPVMRERYDLVVSRRAYFHETFQRFLAFCRSER
ncbi:MAG: substrate-binding domain-containing protein, partial [Bacteroidota bacterium]